MGMLDWVSSASLDAPLDKSLPLASAREEFPFADHRPSKERVALCVIAGDDLIEQGFERMLRSAKRHFSGLVVVANGSSPTARDDLFEIFERVGVRGDAYVVDEVQWKDDFAQQRNISFASALKYVKPDWLFWLDCDDVLPDDFDLAPVIAEARKRRAHGVLMQYDYKVDDKLNTLVSHFKERLFRADVQWNWEGPIHESCVGPVASRMIKSSAGQRVIHLRGEDEANVAGKRARNRRIVAHWFRQEPNNPRVQMLMAHEVFAEADSAREERENFDAIPEEPGIIKSRIVPAPHLELYATAFRLYMQVVDYSQTDDDAHHATLQAGRCLRALGEYNRAVDMFMQSVKMRPTWVTAYVEVAETFLAAGDPEKCIMWADLGMDLSDQHEDTLHVSDTLDAYFRPMVLKANAYETLGKDDEALTYYSYANGAHYSEEIARRILVLEERERHPAKLVLGVTQLRPGPDGEFKKPVITEVESIDGLREKLWGDTSRPSIAFWTRPHFAKWDEGTLARDGLGGTETMVINLAKEYARCHFRVVIFGTPEQEGLRDGIEWWDAGRFHPDEPFDTFVSVRTPEMMLAPLPKETTKIVWLHDVAVGPVDPACWDAAHMIVVPSAWHKQHTADTYNIHPSSIKVIFNGVNAPISFKEVEKEPGNFVYASSPDRGLMRLLDLWPQIREQMPDAKLNIYYGWDSIQEIIANRLPQAPQLQHFMETMEAKLDELGREEAGIYWHGRVNQEVLQTALAKATVMPYPADFLETFGIVFVQALQHGCIPVVPALGNLPDLMMGAGLGKFIVDAPPNSEAFERPFLARLFMADAGAMMLDMKDVKADTNDRYYMRYIAQAWRQLVNDINFTLGQA